MRTATGGARRSAAAAARVSARHVSESQLAIIMDTLDEAKAEEVVKVDLQGKTSLGDFMVVASGRSDRHVGAIADQIQRKLKEHGFEKVRVEGQPQCDWVIVDTGDVIVHVFRPEVRQFYNLEKMWSADRPPETAH